MCASSQRRCSFAGLPLVCILVPVLNYRIIKLAKPKARNYNGADSCREVRRYPTLKPYNGLGFFGGLGVGDLGFRV